MGSLTRSLPEGVKLTSLLGVKASPFYRMRPPYRLVAALPIAASVALLRPC